MDRVTYVHGISSGGDLAGVAFSQSPVQVVREAVFAEVVQGLVINLKGRDVGCTGKEISMDRNILRHEIRILGKNLDIRDWAIASSENASMKVGS